MPRAWTRWIEACTPLSAAPLTLSPSFTPKPWTTSDSLSKPVNATRWFDSLPPSLSYVSLYFVLIWWVCFVIAFCLFYRFVFFLFLVVLFLGLLGCRENWKRIIKFGTFFFLVFSVCSNFCFCWVLNNEETEIILFFSNCPSCSQRPTGAIWCFRYWVVFIFGPIYSFHGEIIIFWPLEPNSVNFLIVCGVDFFFFFLILTTHWWLLNYKVVWMMFPG